MSPPTFVIETAPARPPRYAKPALRLTEPTIWTRDVNLARKFNTVADLVCWGADHVPDDVQFKIARVEMTEGLWKVVGYVEQEARKGA